MLINEDEARSTIELDEMYVVQPTAALWFGHEWENKGKPLPEGFRYTSETNPDWLSIEQIKEIVAPFEESKKDAY